MSRKDRPRKRPDPAAFEELAAIRKPLLAESREFARRSEYLQGKPAHACCTRELNTMRISPLEARAILVAFRRDPELRRKLPEVLVRLEVELRTLADSEERQHFDCPLLDGTKCLVHHAAKPIGCAAWHPPAEGEDVRWSKAAWRAFEARDVLNDEQFGRQWKLRAIPLWLARVFGKDLAELAALRARSAPAAESTKTGRNRAAPSYRAASLPAGVSETSETSRNPSRRAPAPSSARRRGRAAPRRAASLRASGDRATVTDSRSPGQGAHRMGASGPDAGSSGASSSKAGSPGEAS
jgi:hypothetical protein